LENMRAALYDRYGTADVLYAGTVPIPTRTAGEVLVRVHAASVNSIDTIVRQVSFNCLPDEPSPREPL